MQSLAMLHHLSIAVTDIGRAAEFYDHTLAALGYRRVWADLRAGEEGHPSSTPRPRKQRFLTVFGDQGL